MIELANSSDTDSSIEDIKEMMWTESDSSSSSSEEDVPKAKRVRVKNFMASIEKYSEKEFVSHFRLKRSITYSLIDQYKNSMTRHNRGGTQEIIAEKRFLVTLWYLSNTDTFREISNLFDISISSAHRCIVRVTHWLVHCAHLYIKWPKEQAEQEAIENKFVQMKGLFPHVLGTIDGSHIQISKPQINSIDYYNRKKYYSILLQGVVGSDCKFYDIHVGEPGSMHDGRMLKKTELYKRCSENQDSLIHDRRVILGDSAYPCLTWLIPPFRDLGNLSDSQKHFNKRHSATRVVVEHAFGLLKNKFRRLTKFENISIDFVVNCTIAACVLHNIGIDKNDFAEADGEIDVTPDGTIEENLIIEENTNRRQELLDEMFPDAD